VIARPPEIAGCQTHNFRNNMALTFTGILPDSYITIGVQAIGLNLLSN
jgi:hypothetical protein